MAQIYYGVMLVSEVLSIKYFGLSWDVLLSLK